MRNIPVAPIALILVGVNPHTRDGEPVVRDGIPITNVSVLLPPKEGQKPETFEVRVPSPHVPKGLVPFTQVAFTELVGRPWAIDGRSGVSFSASAVSQPKPTSAT